MHKQFLGALASSPEAVDKICEYFYVKTKELIDQNSLPLIGTNTRSINVVRDVLKYVPVYWAAAEIVGCYGECEKGRLNGFYRVGFTSRLSNTLTVCTLRKSCTRCSVIYTSKCPFTSLYLRSTEALQDSSSWMSSLANTWS